MPLVPRSSRMRLLIGVALAAAISLAFLGQLLPQALTSSPSGVSRIPTATATPGLSQAQQAALALHVVGNHLVTQDGQQVMLRGINRDGTDFLCAESSGIFDGPVGLGSVNAMLAWHINAVRLLLNEGCWFGDPGLSPAYSGEAYRAAIAAYVRELTGHGIYVIVDLHKVAIDEVANTHTFFRMPDAARASTFWEQVATAYKDNGMVLFDLYNEPHQVTWDCWRNGGICDGVTYPTIGMQSLVNTVRATGATNVLLLPGISWAQDIGHWLDYAPADPLHNLAVSWHVYPYDSYCGHPACFQTVVAPVAASVPLVVTEFSANLFGGYCHQDQVAALLQWMETQGAGYLAFSWNVGDQSCSSMSLISAWDGTPHAPNGTYFKAYLLAVTDPSSPPVPTPSA